MSLALADPAVALRASVVMCTYNGAVYLAEQCESLLAQSRLPDEVVISDDASSDATPAIVESFASRFRAAGVEVVTHLRQINVGFVRNFNDALCLATGDVVFLCDQDDIWSRHKLETMVACFSREVDLLLLFTDARRVDAEGIALAHSLFDALELSATDWEVLRSGRGFSVLLRRAVVTGATAAFRRSLIDLALPVPAGWIHDEWLATVGALLGRIAPLSKALIDYRQHGGNQIGIRKRTLRMRILDVFLPRSALLRGALQRMDGLRERFGDDIRVPAPWRALLAERIAHYKWRLMIGSRSRLVRLPSVLSEWRSGRYRRHSNGFSSALRDVLRVD